MATRRHGGSRWLLFALVLHRELARPRLSAFPLSTSEACLWEMHCLKDGWLTVSSCGAIFYVGAWQRRTVGFWGVGARHVCGVQSVWDRHGAVLDPLQRKSFCA